MYLWTAFIVGLVGSLHCVGMCGPIALALPKGGPSQLRFPTGRVLYNTGRVLTYTLMGFVWGLLGQGISLAGYQQGLSLALGVSLLLALLVSVNLESRFIAIPLIDRLMLRLRKALGKLVTFEDFFHKAADAGYVEQFRADDPDISWRINSDTYLVVSANL